MDELIVRILRAVACMARLRLLSRLAQTDEAAPTTLARDLRMRLNLVCTHLARLASAGLIQRRRSGVWCYCKAESPYSTEALSGKITSWLCEALRASGSLSGDEGRRQAHRARRAKEQAEVHRIVFDAATAFTHARRLQILRRLAGGDRVELRALAAELHMSPAAATRHTAKLVRRGYIESHAIGRRLAYRRSSTFKTRIHSKLFEIVSAEWSKRRRRS
jgi:DNA-binding MarR family transcriptional regulator